MSGKAGSGRRLARLSVLMLLLVLCMAFPAHAATDRIAKAKTNVVSGGKFVSTSSGLKYKKSNGKYIKKKWAYIGGKVYYFKKTGIAATKWFYVGGDKYCASNEGVVYYSKLVKTGGAYYYLKKDGLLAKSTTLKIGGYYCTFDKNGVMTSKSKNKPTAISTATGKNVGYVSFIFVGDSRTVGMSSYVKPRYKTVFIGKVSTGYSWLNSYAGGRVKLYLNKNPKARVVFMFGVNDTGNISKYISYYKSLVTAYPRAKFTFVSVNPIQYPSWSSVTDKMIQNFNKKLKQAFGTNAYANAKYLDTYTYLKENGFSTIDTVHYDSATYNKLFSYIMTQVVK